jgi:hypothetical protein
VGLLHRIDVVMTLARTGSDEVAPVDLLDRRGDVTISLAEVDLVHISLREVVSSVDKLTER